VITWGSFTFPPINLWNFPRQERDYNMRNVAADNRARSLKLNPRPRHKKESKIIIEPSRGDYDIRLVTDDRMKLCIDMRNRRRG